MLILLLHLYNTRTLPHMKWKYFLADFLIMAQEQHLVYV